jgi:TIGR00159 family protein
MQAFFNWIANDVANWFKNLFTILINTVSWRDLVDIVLVAYIIYELILIVRQTRVSQLLRGLVVLLVAYFVASPGVLDLKTIYFIINTLLQFGLLAVVVIFQPEIRRALEQVGNARFPSSLFQSKLSSAQKEMWQSAVVTICDSAERMAKSKTGALIVIERLSSLAGTERTGTKIDAQLTRELLETIFYEGSPLHDGAVIINNARVSAAGCLLPVSQTTEISKDMGTRHRAAIGLSESTDALVVVVSEETGLISLAQNGVILRRLDRANLYRILDNDLIPKEDDENDQKSFLGRLFRR